MHQWLMLTLLKISFLTTPIIGSAEKNKHYRQLAVNATEASHNITEGGILKNETSKQKFALESHPS